jgi:hypothetical protein
MDNSTTIVSALYNINRHLIDGRTWQYYLDWFSATLKLKCPMVLFVQEDIVDLVKNIRKDLPTHIVVQTLEEIPFYYLKDKIDSIISDASYLNKIQSPDRIECKLALYNIIQYSKFEWLKRAIQENWFDSTHFFWMDAGCSRFFNGFEKLSSSKLPSKFLIQGNVNTNKIIVDDSYKWRSDCVLVGTFFGGPKYYVTIVSDKIKKLLDEEMISENMINNEQIALAYIQKRYPELFDVYIELNSGHLPILNCLK